MSLEQQLKNRSNSTCELCKSTEKLTVYSVEPSDSTADTSILVCETCLEQLGGNGELNENHWRCLNESMWSETPAVQVVAYRMLSKLKTSWANDLLDMFYLDEATLSWAKSVTQEENSIVHLDTNGVQLQNGDSVVITQTLNVKGSSVTAKRGTTVRKIRLVYDNAEQIEGRVDGQMIVILTKYVKKA